MNKENSIVIPTPSDDPIQLMINDYKTHISETQLKDEVYKWKLLEEYKGRPDLEAKDLYEEIKSIDYSNLMYHLSKAVINELAEAKPDEIRKLFAELFDESIDLTMRVKSFSEQTNTLYKGLGKTNQHHQDERAISAYLTYRYPEKYTFYKHAFYKKYCNLLGIKQAKKNEKYAHYLSLIDELIEEYITSDAALIEQIKSFIPSYYDGINHKLLAQDILYQMQEKNAGVNYWVFQGNPKQFDFEQAMKQNAIGTWTVTAHKDKIKEGDKVILWLTGEEAGCYALAEVTSKPYERTTALDDAYWIEENKNSTVVDIDITHNLIDSPLLKDDVEFDEELKDAHFGNQGTNFSATEKEYKTILETIEQSDKFEETKSKFDLGYGPELFESFINMLRKIIAELDLEADDQRIAFTVRPSKINFIIGQRYCFNIHFKYPYGVYGYILKEELGNNSYHYKGNPKAYFNSTDNFALISEKWSSIIESMKGELKKTTKSNFWRNNNKEFEDFVFKIDTPANGNGKMTTPTNTILYGPPGTGKTYNTINEALRIIDNDFLLEHVDDRKALNELFRNLRFNPERGEGQIAFITFHQSLSYEDFIEGIKPVKSEGEETVKYEVCDGLFKSIAIKASDKKVVVSFDEIYDQFKNHVLQQDSFSLQTPYQKRPFDVLINGNGNCVAIPQTETGTEMVVTKKMIADFLLDGTVRDWKPYLSSIAEYIKTNYEYRVDREDNTQKPYVIIIDEINRGNISQIFGELITLIEPDKRKGQAEEIEVILPYSKERFSVPSNLHIIGTMNTADRSVEALDTALRRRFSFLEMNPVPWLLNKEEFRCEDIDLNAMLMAINGRIEKLLDKDYCIGHSYFMTIKNKQESLEELKYIFQNKILPLLQEYFYGDWGKIRLIVGKDFVEMKKSDIGFLDADNQEDIEEFDEKLIYNFTHPLGWTLDSFKRIYE